MSRGSDFQFPAATDRAACERCVRFLLSCSFADKKHTGGSNPCEECRWYGGRDPLGCRPSTSNYNDSAWNKMIVRPDFNYTLPKGFGNARVGDKVESMDAQKILPDWRGKSRENLECSPDWLPDDVRQHPRAYLEPPVGIYGPEAKAAKLRKKEAHQFMPEPAVTDSSQRPQQPAATTYTPVVSLDAPLFWPMSHQRRPFAQTLPDRGRVLTASLTQDFATGKWVHEYTYETGSPIQASGTSSFNAQERQSLLKRRATADNEQMDRELAHSAKRLRQRSSQRQDTISTAGSDERKSKSKQMQIYPALHKDARMKDEDDMATDGHCSDQSHIYSDDVKREESDSD